MLLHHFIENSANRYPDKVAVIHDDQRISYLQLNVQADNLAAHLQTSGITKGDRIALLFENGIEYITAYYAALKIGAVVAPLNPLLKPGGLQYLLNNLEPAAILTSFKSERQLKAIDLHQPTLKLLMIKNPKQTWNSTTFSVSVYDEAISGGHALLNAIDMDDTDLASIIYTSGSTGKPKGVMLSHKNIVSNTDSICQYLDLSKKDIQMVVLPFFYVMGKSLLNTHMAVGGTIVINNRFMYPADVIHQMIKEAVTSFSGVPSTYAYLLNRSPLVKSREKLNHLRYCSQAGGHMAKSIKQELRQSLPEHTQIVVMYGATEAAARLTYLAPEIFESKIESIGQPIPDVSIRILDEKGGELPDGEEGELVASGDNIMRGYWNDPQGTAQVLSEHGYHTGDIGYRDTEGFLYVLRRKDGLLKVGGHRVNPVEIEDFLMSTELLIEAAVVGRPDALMGTALTAIVTSKEKNCDINDLIEKCAIGLPKHKCPSEIILVRALPKNANGKIDHSECLRIALKTQ